MRWQQHIQYLLNSQYIIFIVWGLTYKHGYYEGDIPAWENPKWHFSISYLHSAVCVNKQVFSHLYQMKKYIAPVWVLMHVVYICSLILKKKMMESLEIIKVIPGEMRNYHLSHFLCWIEEVHVEMHPSLYQQKNIPLPDK